MEYDEFMSVAVSGCIGQVIHLDNSGPQTWDSSRTTCVDVQLLDCEVFKRVTGLDPPKPPISAMEYRERGYLYHERSNNETSELNTMFSDVRPVNQIDKERLRTRISEDAIKQLEMVVGISKIEGNSQETRGFRHRRTLEGEVGRALQNPNLKKELRDMEGPRIERFPLTVPERRRTWGPEDESSEDESSEDGRMEDGMAEDGRVEKRNTGDKDEGRESTLYRWVRKVFGRIPRVVVVRRSGKVKRAN